MATTQPVLASAMTCCARFVFVRSFRASTTSRWYAFGGVVGCELFVDCCLCHAFQRVENYQKYSEVVLRFEIQDLGMHVE